MTAGHDDTRGTGATEGHEYRNGLAGHHPERGTGAGERPAHEERDSGTGPAPEHEGPGGTEARPEGEGPGAGAVERSQREGPGGEAEARPEGEELGGEAVERPEGEGPGGEAEARPEREELDGEAVERPEGEEPGGGAVERPGDGGPGGGAGARSEFEEPGGGAEGRSEFEGPGGGVDALMVAITGESPPERVRRDPAFRAEHQAAEADLALLRDRLAWLAEALTGEAGEDAAAGGARPAVARPHRPRDRTRPAGPSRRRPARRTARVALGVLVGAAAFCLALGLGRLAASGGGVAQDDGAASAKSGTSAADGGRPADPARELACSQLVVEGTVTRVERKAESSSSRVTLSVSRSYRPAHGPADVAVLLDADARPAPRAGQHVLVRVARGERSAALWAVGDDRVAAARAWITDALPGSRDLACPAEDGAS
ncbi:hypothetical protein [Streptomyces sp. NPDC051129]|uniref:hypothetical protein n=1 Tax=Streptomyces sp. NPDC051129 TaxID=3154639 RepID=UPI00342CE39F